MKYIFLLLSLLIILSIGYGQETYNVDIVVKNIDDSRGTIYLGLYNNPHSFKSKTNAIDSVIVTPKNGSIVITLENIVGGEYAIAIFQDINKNGKLDTGKLKIPEEPVGISNHTDEKRLGVPNYQKAKIKINGDTTVSIPLISTKK